MAEIYEQVISRLGVSSRVMAHLSQLAKELDKRLGDNLVSIFLYGSVARDEWHERTSDINVLVVCRDLHFASLESIGDVMATARRQARVVPMFSTPEEIRHASDIYSIKFDDICRHYICICGEDMLEELEVDDAHFRFVCEFELRNISMRMRQFFLQSFGQQRMEQSFLLRFFTSSMVPLRALCGLLQLEQPTSTPDAIEVIGQALDTDIEVLRRLHEIHRAGEVIQKAEMTRLYENFHQLICLAIERVDALS